MLKLLLLFLRIHIHIVELPVKSCIISNEWNATPSHFTSPVNHFCPKSCFSLMNHKLWSPETKASTYCGVLMNTQLSHVFTVWITGNGARSLYNGSVLWFWLLNRQTQIETPASSLLNYLSCSYEAVDVINDITKDAGFVFLLFMRSSLSGKSSIKVILHKAHDNPCLLCCSVTAQHTAVQIHSFIHSFGQPGL